MSQTETSKKSQKKAAEKAAPAEKTAPEVQPEEATKPAPAAEEKAPEAPAEAPEADAKAEEGAESENKPFNLGNLFSTLFTEVKDSDLLNDLKEGKFAFAPEGFFLAEGDEGFAFDGPCPGPCAEACDVDPDADYNAGIAEGLRRAQHPVFGIGIAIPEPVAPAPSPIVIRDEETRSMAHLVELKKLLDVGILTEAEYTSKKTDILRRIY